VVQKKVTLFLFTVALFVLSCGASFFFGRLSVTASSSRAIEQYRAAAEASARDAEQLRGQVEELGDAGRGVLEGVTAVGDRLGDVFTEVQRVTDSRKRADTLGRAMVSEVRELIRIVREAGSVFESREGTRQ
jgi:hypothetical protein